MNAMILSLAMLALHAAPAPDAPKPAELKVPAGGSFIKTPRGGVLLRQDGSVEVIFDYGRDVQQRDIDDWFARQSQGYSGAGGCGAAAYSASGCGAASSSASNGCGAASGGRRGLLRGGPGLLRGSRRAGGCG